MSGLCHSNELISRDEGMHRDAACLVYNKYIINKLNTIEVKDIIKSAVVIEQDFINESLPYSLAGMNKALMNQYIQYVADHLSVNLINERIYNTENPFPWMNLISVEGKTNFFEKKNSSYSRTAVITTKEQQEVRFDEDF